MHAGLPQGHPAQRDLADERRPAARRLRPLTPDPPPGARRSDRRASRVSHPVGRSALATV
ncbi:hypothetical protein [Ornithinimicrobium kibberense]|uniref:hypothetical protein n=1 Tax=Ornithinimicrobium kibberense TaxID=282060 RepID=UPI003605C03C